MDNQIKILKRAIASQNKFILELFNDDRIPENIIIEYANKYNKLQIKTKIDKEMV